MLTVKWYEPSPAAKSAVKMARWRATMTQYISMELPYCDAPVIVSQSQRPGAAPGVYVERRVPCRKCEKCLRFRRLKWRERMRAELIAAPRSWFVTLTFDEIHLAGVIMESHARKEWDEAARVEAAAYKHVQGYFKRLRKHGASFRYSAIPEYGDEKGRLHYHLLLHEIEPHSLPYRLIDTKWRSFVNASLVRNPQGAASYVCKYLTKSLSRIRASSGYGHPPLPRGRTIEETIIGFWDQQAKKPPKRSDVLSSTFLLRDSDKKRNERNR